MINMKPTPMIHENFSVKKNTTNTIMIMVDTCGNVATRASTVFSLSGNTAVNLILPPLCCLVFL